MTQYTGNWSFSSLMDYEACPLRFKLKKIDRLPEPERPPNNPLERGTRIHERLENFVQGKGPMDEESKKIGEFTHLFDHAQELFIAGNASVEHDWLFDNTWEVTDRSGVWLWSKLDLNVTDESTGTSIIIDYKTGGSQWKAWEHHQQMMLYAAAAVLRQDFVETAISELWYLDEGWVKTSTYTREEAMKFVGTFERRADAIFEDKFFRGRPNAKTCKWCPFSPRGTGACPVGV